MVTIVMLTDGAKRIVEWPPQRIQSINQLKT